MKAFSLKTGAALSAMALLLFAAVSGGAQGTTKPSMELLETKQSASASTLEITGQVKNISPREVSGVTVYCDFADAAGKSIKTAQGHLEIDPLGPNKVSEFKVSTPYNAAIKRYNVRFGQMFGGPLVMKDSRKP